MTVVYAVTAVIVETTMTLMYAVTVVHTVTLVHAETVVTTVYAVTVVIYCDVDSNVQ